MFSVHTLRPALLISLGGLAWLGGCGGGGGEPEAEAQWDPAGQTQVLQQERENDALAAPLAQPDASEPSVHAVRLLAATAGEAAVAPLAAAAALGALTPPFAVDSPWNSRPLAPVFGTAVVPPSLYYPQVAGGAYSTQAFEAGAGDPPMTLTGTDPRGVWDPDAEVYRPSITLPHWPPGVLPAAGSDGHAEVIDRATGIVHSFYKLQQVAGKWQARQYAWTALAGSGWGDPAHYFQGARSAGVSTLGGLIRAHELGDGATMYSHALAMSMPNTGLSALPTYQFPATSADSNAATTNSGPFPIGSLMMLPPDFDLQTLSSPELRKVAATLQTFGAYLVDRNTGTPYVIYVENGAGFTLYPKGWNQAVANDLQRIRGALRQVVGSAGWLDANGAPRAAVPAPNLLSMRGYWYRSAGAASGVFDSWTQSLTFAAAPLRVEQANTGGRAFAGVGWSLPVPGQSCRLAATATGGATLRVVVQDKSGSAAPWDSGYLAAGQQAAFSWPAASVTVKTYARSGVGVASTVRGDLRCGT